MAVEIFFYIFAILALIGAIASICARNTVRAVLSLVFTFVCTAAIWMLLEAEFLSLVLIVVYVGAVMVLFLFVVMMLEIRESENKASFVRYWPVAILIGVAMTALIIWVVGPEHFGLAFFNAPKSEPLDYSNIKALGTILFTHYIYPFELASVLLLAGMISAITLTFRGRRPGAKSQRPSEQVKVCPEDRLTLVDMPSENDKKLRRKH